jgi:tripartite-type tricarboxylate transporter receptor subunit TctC
MTDTLAGTTQMMFPSLVAAGPHIKSGKLRAIAVTTTARSSAMPEVPTVAESGKAIGLGSFDINTWFGLFGPAKMPADVTHKLNKAFVDALATPELKARLSALMAESMASTPEQFGAFVKRENAKYEKVVKASGAKVE